MINGDQILQFDPILKRINSSLAAGGACLLLLMAALLVVDVTFRALLEPIQIIPELSVFAMMITIYLGLADCERRGEHICIELFHLGRNRDRPHVFILLRQFLTIIGVVVLLYAMLVNGLGSYFSGEGTEGMVTIKIWPIKLIMIVGAVVFLCETLLKPFRP